LPRHCYRTWSWLKYLSLFHYMALVPAQDADLVTLGVNVLVAGVLAVLAIAIFRHRDLQAT